MRPALASVQQGTQTAYLLGIAPEHRVDQLDPMGQAGGDHIAWPVRKPNLLAQVANLELCHLEKQEGKADQTP